MHNMRCGGLNIHTAPFMPSGSFEGLDWLLACLPRAAPRLRLQVPHTTSTSLSLIGKPRSCRRHASGVWSACRSVLEPQSEQNGWSCLARSESLFHAPV